MRVEEEFLDVLQNMEFAIAQAFRRDPTTLDLDVRDTLVALIRQYEAEGQGRHPPGTHLHSRAQSVFDALRSICEWRLGRLSDLPTPRVLRASGRLTREQLLACLKRLRSSVDFWNKEADRQGYLNYVSEFIA